jgi:hypothetical protein
MCRWILLSGLCSLAVGLSAGAAQFSEGRLVSEHIRMRIPHEREWLGRDTIMELERCWRFMHRATGGNLPRRVVAVVLWEGTGSDAGVKDSTVTIGMNHPEASGNLPGFLIHEAAREMARLGLRQLARRTEAVEEDEFLFEGMAEVLAREYHRSTRSLAGTWLVSNLLDRMNLLGLAAQAQWSSFSGGRHDLRSAAPGVTFVTTCREVYGRESALKLFENLKRGSLRDSIFVTFRTSAAALENAWLKKVREHSAWEDLTITSEQDVPVLEKIVVQEKVRPGEKLVLQAYLTDRTNDLLTQGVFVLEPASEKVFQASEPSDQAAKYKSVEIPVEKGRAAGNYSFKLIVVDEAGNVRSWDGRYSVVP